MRDLIRELVSHCGDLRRQLSRDLRDPHHAADIAQSSFERVYTQVLDVRDKVRRGLLPVDHGDGIDAPRALLFHVARNLCIDEARRRQVAQDWAGAQAGVQGQLAVPSCEYVVAQRQVLDRMVATLEQLPPRRREVFLLFRAEGHTRAEIAQRLGITDMAVAKHLVRATIDCARVFAELRAELIEPQALAPKRPGRDPALAEDFS